MLGYTNNKKSDGFGQYIEPANIENQWQKIGAYTTSTIAFANNSQITIDGASGDYIAHTWMDKRAVAKNCIQVVNAVGNINNLPQIHCRETDANNFSVFYISGGTPAWRDRISGANNTTYLDYISGYSNSKTYEMGVKSYNSRAFITIAEDSALIYQTAINSTNFNGQSGLNNGIGTGNAGSASVYDKYRYKTIEDGEFVNLICLGDSITAGNSLDYGDKYPQQLNYYYRYNPINCLQKGVSGDEIADVVARLATDVTANYITGTTNIVHLMIGTNDCETSRTVAEIFEDMEALWTSIKNAGFTLWVSEISARNKVDPYGDNDLNALKIKPLNMLINASSIPDLVIPLYDDTADPNDNDNYNSSLYLDYVHFDTDGIAIWVAKLKTAINTVFPDVNHTL